MSKALFADILFQYLFIIYLVASRRFCRHIYRLHLEFIVHVHIKRISNQLSKSCWFQQIAEVWIKVQTVITDILWPKLHYFDMLVLDLSKLSRATCRKVAWRIKMLSIKSRFFWFVVTFLDQLLHSMLNNESTTRRSVRATWRCYGKNFNPSNFFSNRICHLQRQAASR